MRRTLQSSSREGPESTLPRFHVALWVPHVWTHTSSSQQFGRPWSSLPKADHGWDPPNFSLQTNLLDKFWNWETSQDLYVTELSSGTEKVPQRTCMTKILPNFRLNFLVRLASKPFFYWVMPSNCSENSLVLFVRILALGFFFRS